MIYENIDIHGCAQLEKLENGANATVRVPQYVYDVFRESAKTQAKNCTGIEFRFVLEEESATLKFRYDDSSRGKITVFYGDFVADWPETTKRLEGECEAVIKKSDNIEILRSLAKQHGHRFSPDVVRLVFEGVRPHIVSVEGKISPPPAQMCPTKKYLAYGSSITHGSISLHPYYYYVERVAANLKADVTNYGLAGSARLEKEMADFIADECEFDFATLEMGINILDIEPEDYEQRVRYFVSRVAKAHPESKIFAIDVYYCYSDIVGDGKAERFRKILQRVVCELSLPNVVYVNGKSVLSDGSKLAAGLVHPNPDGVMEIAKNLTRIIVENI
jgi:lysophospholipase L1-like esterase